MEKGSLTFLGKDSGFGKNNNSAYYIEKNELTIIDCGFSVFEKIKEKLNLEQYNSINIIITHLHNDHSGSLSQLILYLWFVLGKKSTILSQCQNIQQYLDITGTPRNSYILKNNLDNLKFIKTEHTEYLDAYGFILKINNKTIVYTGDTNTIEPFLPYISKCNELYIDVSRFGGAHLKIDDILDTLISLQKRNIKVYLMHLDDIEYIKKIIGNNFII